MLSSDLPGSKTDQTKAFKAQQFECGFEGNLRLMLNFFYDGFLNNNIILIIYIRSCQKVVKRRTRDDII